MTIITADPRHRNMITLYEESKTARQFRDWTMGYLPLTDEPAEKVPGFRSTFRDLEIDEFVDGSREGLRGLLAWYQTQTPSR